MVRSGTGTRPVEAGVDMLQWGGQWRQGKVHELDRYGLSGRRRFPQARTEGVGCFLGVMSSVGAPQWTVKMTPPCVPSQCN